MRKLAGFLIVLVLGLVGLSIAAHVFVDQDALRQRLVQALRRQTGLSMRVARSSIQILPWPSFEATDVVLTHPGDAPLLQAHTLHAGISVFALLHREVRFQDFVIEHATLDLVRDASGRANWTLTPEHEADSTSGPARTGQRIDARWDVSLDGMRVNGAKLLWNDAVGGMSGAFEIDSLDLAGLRSASPWVDLKARHSGTPFTLKGHLGALTQGAVTQPWAFSVGATLGVGPKQDHVDLDGRVADPARLAGIMLTAQGEMSNLRDLQLLFPHASLPDVPALGGNIILGGSVGPFEALRGEGAFGHLRDGLTPVTVHLHAGSIPFRQGLVRNVVLDAAGKDAPVLLTGDAAWRQSAWRVQLGAATLGQAMAAWRDGLKSSVQVNLELRSEDKLFTGSPSINAGDAAHMTLEGTIGGVPSAGVGHLELQGTARTLHLPGAVLHDTVLHGMADGQAENGVALKGLSFASKELTLDAALTLVSSSDAPPLLDGNLHVARADFDVLKGLWLSSAPPSHPLGDPVSADTHVTSGSVGPVAPEAGPQIGSPGHPTVSPSATHPGTPVSAIPDWVQRLRAQDVNLHFSADHILYDGRDYTQLATHLTLSGGHLRLDPISGQAQGVALSGMAELDAGTLPATATVTFEPLVLPAGLLQKQLGLPVLLQGPMQLVGQVSGRGVTLNDLRQSLGGHLGLSVVDGQIESAALRQLAGPAAGVLPNSGTQRLRCLGVHMMLSDDVAHLDTLGFQAGRLSATGHGTVILGTRDLNLHLVPALDFGGAGASTPVSVTGTPDALHVAQDRDARGNFHLTLGGGAPTDPCAAALAAAREGVPGLTRRRSASITPGQATFSGRWEFCIERQDAFLENGIGEGRERLFLPCLDDRPIRLPQGAHLALRSRGLADAIAGEWAAIGEGATFTPEALPLTRMAGTMIERIAADEKAARERLVAFGVDDALCYRDQHLGADHALVTAVFEWLSGYRIYPTVTGGLVPVTQTDAYMAGVRRLLSNADALTLEATGVFAQATGSLLLALALVDGVISPVDAAIWSNREEEQQLRIWGQDHELVRVMETRERDILDAGLFLRLGRAIVTGHEE